MPDPTAPPISILLPVFNGALYLREQVSSILAQSHRDFELLAYDDGSSDGSGELLRTLASADPRMRVSSGGTNAGQRFALRQLLQHAGGRHLMFSDQDDVWHPRKIEILRAAIGDASLAYGTSHLIDSQGQATGKTIFDFNGPPLHGRDCTDFLFRNVVSGHAMLVRREVVDPGVFLFSAPYDWLIAILASFSQGVVHAPDAIVHHRQHAGNQLNMFGRQAAAKGRQSKRWGRIMRLHDALALLRAVPSIAEDKRSVFDALYGSLCDDVILAPPKAFGHAAFAASFAAALEKLQISAPEQRRARQAVGKICAGVLHPRTIRDAFR
jgi:glycosyltransferase involved in cell wall biosynthesis